MVAQGFVSAVERNRLRVAESPAALIDDMLAFEPPVVSPWLGLRQT
jgi:predicted Rossmann-fold nucleotide-binding protein